MAATDPVTITLSRQQWHDVATFIDQSIIDGVDPEGVQELCHFFMVHRLFDDSPGAA